MLLKTGAQRITATHRRQKRRLGWSERLGGDPWCGAAFNGLWAHRRIDAHGIERDAFLSRSARDRLSPFCREHLLHLQLEKSVASTHPIPGSETLLNKELQHDVSGSGDFGRA